MAELGHQLPDQRQAHPHHVVVVALDRGDEGTTEAVHGERAGHVQRLAGGDVRRDLLVGDLGEVHRGRRGGGGHPAGRGVVQAVAGPQHPRTTAHLPPPLDRLVGVVGLPERLPVQLQHRVAAQHQGPGRQVVARGHRRALQLGELEGQLGGREPVQLGLVDTRHHHHRLQARAAQRGQSRRGGRGEDEGVAR